MTLKAAMAADEMAASTLIRSLFGRPAGRSHRLVGRKRSRRDVGFEFETVLLDVDGNVDYSNAAHAKRGRRPCVNMG